LPSIVEPTIVGVIAGSIVGVLVLAVVCGVIVWKLRKYKQRSSDASNIDPAAALSAAVVANRHILDS